MKSTDVTFPVLVYDLSILNHKKFFNHWNPIMKCIFVEENCSAGITATTIWLSSMLNYKSKSFYKSISGELLRISLRITKSKPLIMLKNSLFQSLFRGFSIVAIYISREERKMIWVSQVTF